MPPEDADHCCSVTLIVIGDTLSDSVLEWLKLPPNRTWVKGERKSIRRPDGSTFYLDSINQNSGWKFFRPQQLKEAGLQEQLGHWLGYISNNETQLIRLSATKAKIILDIYVSSLEAVNLQPVELDMLGRCGIELDWSIYP